MRVCNKFLNFPAKFDGARKINPFRPYCVCALARHFEKLAVLSEKPVLWSTVFLTRNLGAAQLVDRVISGGQDYFCVLVRRLGTLLVLTLALGPAVSN